MKQFDLHEQTALVTGAAGLLGYEHAAAICEAGGCVVMVDINETRLNLASERLKGNFTGSTITEFVCDVGSELEVRSMHDALAKKGIFPEILINNAAPNPAPPSSDDELDNSFENFELARWENEIQNGLVGTFVCSKIFGSEMARVGRGSIINIASDLSVISPDQRIYSSDEADFDKRLSKPVTYSVSKSAVVGLTRYLATYWARENVRVNALSPGGVFNGQPNDFVSRLESRIPMGRMAYVDEYRGAIVFLASSASSYLTGQNLIIDGGRTAW